MRVTLIGSLVYEVLRLPGVVYCSSGGAAARQTAAKLVALTLPSSIEHSPLSLQSHCFPYRSKPIPLLPFCLALADELAEPGLQIL
jgi:hypothetical protein